MKRKYIVILSVLLLLVGMCVLIYPVVSSRINEMHSSYAVQNLNAQMVTVEEKQLLAQISRAEAYNRVLSGSGQMDEKEATALMDDYNHILNFGNGIMGSILIPKIDVSLPIYHGVSDGILAKAVGHLPQSAFPIGGEGNHAVLTGHTGLPNAALFTNLTELVEGDIFYVHIADRVLVYQVDQIRVVLPSETKDLAAVPGEDYCTLVTCTPYGVNSHRLLVRGSRTILDDAEAEQVIRDQLDEKKGIPLELIVAGMLVLAGLAFLLLLTARLLSGKR